MASAWSMLRNTAAAYLKAAEDPAWEETPAARPPSGIFRPSTPCLLHIISSPDKQSARVISFFHRPEVAYAAA
jgi:hypothetical protein